MDPQKCLANAKIFDPSAVLCPDSRCNGGSSKYLNARCHCSPPYTQNPCPYTADSPVWIDDSTPNGCYCCCSCFAYGVEIMDGNESVKTIEKFLVGDTVLVATQDPATQVLTWVERTVEFSNGVEPSAENGKTVVTVYYTLEQESRELVVTPDHVFLVYNEDLQKRKLTRAEQLDIFKDRLLDREGQPIPITAKETGGWWHGLHHIATTEDAATDPDYHLLISNGVVTGDWALQIAKLADTAHIAIEPAPDWSAQKSISRHGFHQRAEGFDPAERRPEGFTPYSVDHVQVPTGARLFLRRDQADDIHENASQYPVTVSGSQEVIYYLFRQLHSYYTNVLYYLQWEEDWPNAFAYQEFGASFVVITGGLVRTEGLSVDGLLTILASTTGRIVGGEPLVPRSTFSCVGQSDYFATLAVLRNVLLGQEYRTRSTNGLNDIRKLFEYINPEHRGGMPGNVCDVISTDCRLEALTAGRSMLPLPACAGGPLLDFLEVLKVTTKRQSDGTEVTILFNEKLNVLSAQEKTNYGLQPGVPITSLKVPEGKQDTVVLKARLVLNTSYVLTIRNILSESGLALENDEAILPIK